MTGANLHPGAVTNGHEDRRPDRLLRPEEVAELLSVSKRQVADMARAGEIRYVPVGRFVRFRRKDVDEWIERSVR
jgi:excisionase family DNA binding protein